MGRTARSLAPVVLSCVLVTCGGQPSLPAAPSATAAPPPSPAPLPAGPAPLTGRVTTDAGAPLAGARVSIRPNPFSHSPSVYSNDVGEYRFESLTPGDTLITAEARRFQPIDKRVVVDGVNRLDFVLSALPRRIVNGKS